jgi:hypothetical protein
MTLTSRVLTLASMQTSTQFRQSDLLCHISTRLWIIAMVQKTVVTGAWKWIGLRLMEIVEALLPSTLLTALEVMVAPRGVAVRSTITILAQKFPCELNMIRMVNGTSR